MKVFNRHYIAADDRDRIIDGFSDAFKQPQDGDICINEQGGYQFRLFPDGEENPLLVDDNGCHLYRYENGQIRKATDAELAAELAEIETNRPPAPPTPIEELQAENRLQKAQLMAQGDRQDFIEGCIAEMAMQLYA